MKYFELHVLVIPRDYEEYSILIDVPGDCTDCDAVQKAVTNELFREPSDVNYIDFIGELAEDEFFMLKKTLRE